MKHHGFLLLITAGVFWGIGGIPGQVLQTEFGLPSLAVATYRLLAAGALISVFVLATGRLSNLTWSKAAVGQLLANAVLHAAFQSLYFISLALIPVGLATLVKIGSVPVFVAIGMCVGSGTLPRSRLLVSVLLAVAGLVLLVGFPGVGASTWQTVAGLTCSVTAGLTFSVMTLVNRSGPLDPMTNVGLGLLIGGVLLIPAGLTYGMELPARGDVLGLMGFLVLIPTVAAYLCYFAGLRTSSDAGTAVGVISEPLTAAVLSMLLLGERMSLPAIVGAGLLLTAMLADYVGPRRTRNGGGAATLPSQQGSH